MNAQFARVIASAASIFIALPAYAGSTSRYHIAFLAASRPNIFNQAVYEGMQSAAKQLGVDIEIFDGAFNPSTQFSQVEDIVASGRFNALAVLPNDSVGIVPALEEATKAGLKVAVVQFPVGPDLDSLKPQVSGLTTTVATSPSEAAQIQADAVVKYCAAKPKCRVAVLIGRKIYPFDKRKYDVFAAEFAKNPNISIVATVEGAYDTDTSMKGMQDALQANPGLDVILSIADQETLGAEVAAKDAGIDPNYLFIVSGGGTDIGVERVRSGKWAANLAEFPVSQGEIAVRALVDALNGKPVTASVDALKVGRIPSLITPDVLKSHPDFVAEWKG